MTLTTVYSETLLQYGAWLTEMECALQRLALMLRACLRSNAPPSVATDGAR